MPIVADGIGDLDHGDINPGGSSCRPGWMVERQGVRGEHWTPRGGEAPNGREGSAKLLGPLRPTPIILKADVSRIRRNQTGDGGAGWTRTSDRRIMSPLAHHESE